jgi:hypothetical protein
MDLSAREYEITPEPIRRKTAWQLLGIRGAQLAFIFLAFLSVQWATDTFVLHRVRKGWVDLLLMPVVVALALSFSLFRNRPSTILAVGEDFVERRIAFGSRTLTKRISRLRVKSIVETTLRPGTPRATRGLAVRDRGTLGSWMFGYVFIPETTPDYPEIRNQLKGWISNRP